MKPQNRNGYEIVTQRFSLIYIYNGFAWWRGWYKSRNM